MTIANERRPAPADGVSHRPARPSGRLSDNLVASGYMILAFCVFSAMALLARTVSATIPVIEMVFVRQALTFVLMAPIYARFWPEIRRPRGIRLHLARGVFAVGSMVCGLSAVILIPLADATAIQMAEVFVATALAAWILKEPVGWRRWTAAAVGFLGIAVMIRPFGDGLNLYALVPLAGGCFGAAGMIAVRLGAAEDRTETVMFWQGVVVLVLVTPVTIATWVTPDLATAGILLVMSVIFALGQWLFTKALRMGDTSALAPLNYLRLVMMAALGWAVYDEVPTVWTVVGSMIVLGAATYTIRRNAMARRTTA